MSSLGSLIGGIGALAGDKGSITTQKNVKNRPLQKYINDLISKYGDFTKEGQASLGQYITDYLARTQAGEADASRFAGEETGAISKFYSGDMAAQLAQLRAKREGAVNAAADVAAKQALRNVNLSRVGGEGGPSSYDSRLLISSLAPIRTGAALDRVNQERSDLDYLTGNQVSLAGRRGALQNAITDRADVRGLLP